MVETRAVRAVFTNRGARLKSWQLKTFLDLQKKPQELVATYLPDYRARPFDVEGGRRSANAALKEALFKASAGDGGARGRVGRCRDADVRVQGRRRACRRSKAFTFEPAGFIVRVAVDVKSAEAR